jgi:EAL domain-containing protein (putative c-di-GMP-specific phosphodiesterase class I)
MTSLGYLRDLPLDYVKIDKSFIRKLPHDAASQLIVQFIVELSKEIGFQTIAEGVEDLELLHQVQTLGITIAQGYLIKRPASLVAPSDQWCFDMAGEQQLACPPKETAPHPNNQIS